MIIRGLKRSSGEYEGYKYDNIVCHCLSDDNSGLLYGDAVEIVKVPYPVFMDWLAGSELDAAVGMDVNFIYNKSGKVTAITLR